MSEKIAEMVASNGLKAIATAIPDVLVIEPKVFGDQRGFFFESFNQEAFNHVTGLNANFMQDNHSRSGKDRKSVV